MVSLGPSLVVIFVAGALLFSSVGFGATASPAARILHDGARSHGPTGPASPYLVKVGTRPASPVRGSPLEGRVTAPRESTRTSPEWTSGVQYSGAAVLASSVEVSMTIPDDFPATTDLYFVALSVFDGAESYDQVGFANDNGSWQVYYATAGACDARPVEHWNASSLQRGAAYAFEISIEGGGVVLFEVYSASGVAVWQETSHTGATYLQIESTQTCGSVTLPGLTETETIYTVASGLPPYNFQLTNSTENGKPVEQWANLTGGSISTLVVRTGADTTIFNEVFSLNFGTAPDFVTIEAAASPQVLRTTVSVTLESPGISVGLSAFTTAASWAFTATPASGNATFSSVLNIDLPPSIAPGTYVAEIEASTISGSSNRIALEIHALPGLSLAVGIAPSSALLDANETVTFHPNATGGQPAYAYSWTRVPKSCTILSTEEVACRYAVPGSYSLIAGVSDNLHYALYRNATTTVAPDPVLSLGTDVANVTLGEALELGVNLSGGLRPYTLTWQGLPPGCTPANSTSVTCHPTSPGRYAVTISSTDRTGFHSFLTVGVDIQNPGSSYPFVVGNLGVLLVAVGLLVLIAVCLFVLLRRRRAA